MTPRTLAPPTPRPTRPPFFQGYRPPADHPNVAPSLVLALDDRRALERHLIDEPAGLTAFVPGEWRVAVGDLVVLDVAVAEGSLCFQTRCRVQWRRVATKPGLPVGVGLRPLSPFAAEALLEQRLEPRKRRFGVAFEAIFSSDGFTRRVRLTDISRSGAYLRTPWAPGIGTHFELTVRPGWTAPLELTVASARIKRGEGLAVAFVGQPPAIDELVTATAERALRAAR